MFEVCILIKFTASYASELYLNLRKITKSSQTLTLKFRFFGCHCLLCRMMTFLFFSLE